MRDLRVLTEPFPHLVADDLFDRDLLSTVLAEMPLPDAEGWRSYQNGQEHKLEGPAGLWGPRTRDYFLGLEALAPDLGEAFGIPDLTLETAGGGYHLIPPGGYLAIHTDFSRSATSGLYRRLNLLTYLNPEWQDPGGCLELWNDAGRAVQVVPEMGRTACFATSSL